MTKTCRSWGSGRVMAFMCPTRFPFLPTAVPEPGQGPRSRTPSASRTSSRNQPATRLQGPAGKPFDYEGRCHRPEEEQRELCREGRRRKEEEREVRRTTNSGPRGDVFVSEFESLYGPSTEIQEIPLKPVQEEFILDCNFSTRELVNGCRTRVTTLTGV
ncbi:unnamed protein product [Gadus morhua 'NCC']